ncbi:hypothetical protein ACLX1H_004511 [Fusarium chlamydosporum]
MVKAKIEKRNRPPKSCEPCRTRKNERRPDKGGSVAERLKNLEGLIAMVADQRDSMPSLGLSEGILRREVTNHVQTPKPTPPEGILEFGDRNAARSGLPGHVDASHWSSIMETIRAIRDDLPDTSPQERLETDTESFTTVELSESDNIDFDLGLSGRANIDNILSQLPPRQVCDTLVSLFFRSHYAMLPILHPTKFQQEYEAFWNSPRNYSTIWIALLFSVLSLSAAVYEASGMARNSTFPVPSSYGLSTRTKECLLLGNYITSEEHDVEAFLLHLVGCWLRSKASDTKLWFLMGKVVQLAICKGYHRDHSKVPSAGISPFDGEMRRRVWVCIYQLQALMSFQLGLPSMVPSDCCDTDLPRNLDQSQLHPGITELPPSRPLSENTSILYTIVKASVMAKFKEVVKHTQSTTRPSQESTAVLDAKVREAYNNIPDNFKYKPLTNFIIDDVSILKSRTTIDLLHLKSIIVLHRQHLMHREDSRSEWSRSACLEAAGKLLERQVDIDRVTQPGGPLHDMKWMISTLTLSDFTLAAMVVCLDLTVTMRYGAESCRSLASQEELQRKLAAIENAHKIWIGAGEISAEARTVSHALESTILRVNEFLNTTPLSENLDSWQTLGMTPSSSLAKNFTYQLDDLDMMESIDWRFVDNQFQDPNVQEFDLDMWLIDAAGSLEAGG